MVLVGTKESPLDKIIFSSVVRWAGVRTTTVGLFAVEDSLGTVRRCLRRQSCFRDWRLPVEDDSFDVEDMAVVLDKEEVGFPLFDLVVAVVFAGVAVAVVAAAVVVANVVAVTDAVAVVDVADVWEGV